MTRYLGVSGQVLGGPRKGWREDYEANKCPGCADGSEPKCERCKRIARGGTCHPECLGWEVREGNIVVCDACGLFVPEELDDVLARQSHLPRVDGHIGFVVEMFGELILEKCPEKNLYLIACMRDVDGDHVECDAEGGMNFCSCGYRAPPMVWNNANGEPRMHLTYEVSNGLPGRRSEARDFDYVAEARAEFRRIKKKGW